MSHIGNRPGAEEHPLEKYGVGGGHLAPFSSPIELGDGILRGGGLCVRASRVYVELLWSVFVGCATRGQDAGILTHIIAGLSMSAMS